MPIKTRCKFDDGVVCGEEGVCAGCVVWDRVMNQVEEILDLCPVCGADRNVWLEKFGVEHVCTVGGE